MPRRKTAVNTKYPALGAIDLHFHGAFGVDLMSAPASDMNDLSRELWKKGVAGFCATTLSAPAAELREAVGRMGRWIRSRRAPGARPLGIHLEGPFISGEACGAHPPRTIRKLRLRELDSLWGASLETLKILTVAPETLQQAELKALVKWAKARAIVLSLGHSRATEAEAALAFEAGFKGVTHAWNALPFHQRAPGALGAALGRAEVYLELLIDGVHVDPTVIRWTRRIHPEVCFVSDCVPAAATKTGSWHPFGPLRIRYADGACRVRGGHLAGGGHLLPDAFASWLRAEVAATGDSGLRIFEGAIPSLTRLPLWALGIPRREFADRRVVWTVSSDGRARWHPA